MSYGPVDSSSAARRGVRRARRRRWPSALAAVTGTAAGEMSTASQVDAPSMAAATESTPLPQPTSSTVAPATAPRSTRSDSTVVGWSPSPNVAPGSIRTPSPPVVARTRTHAGTTTRSLATHVGTAWCRHVSATARRPRARCHRQRAGNAARRRASRISRSLPSDVRSSTMLALARSVAPRRRRRRAPTARRTRARPRWHGTVRTSMSATRSVQPRRSCGSAARSAT